MLTTNNNSEKHRQNDDLLRLFVAGVPLQAKRADIIRCFRHFWPLSVELLESNSSSQHRWVLATKSVEVYNKLIQIKTFQFDDQSLLTVMPLRSGIKLIIHNKRLNRCRVILKRVPLSFDECSLWQILETRFGKVQACFKFKKMHQQQKINKPDRFCTYSVTFDNKSSAQAILSLESVWLDQYTNIRVERFSKTTPRPKQSDLQISETLSEVTVKASYFKGTEANIATECTISSSTMRQEKHHQKEYMDDDRCWIGEHHIKPTQRDYSNRPSICLDYRNYTFRIRY